MFVLESYDLQESSYSINNNNDLQLEDFRVFGSCALDLANTANGKIDCYFVKNLDLEKSTAGLFLVKEAGGIIHEDKKLKLSVVTNINKDINDKLGKPNIVGNSTWIPKRFEFSNMFSYGTNNVIDFTNMKGAYGIFAPNASGK